VDARQLNLDLTLENTSNIINMGVKLKKSIQAQIELRHPISESLSFLYGVIFVDDPIVNKNKNDPGIHYSRNVCTFANGEVDRSPTGTGVSGRVAIEYKKGRLKIGESLVVESITNSIFTGKVHSFQDEYYGFKDAVIPEISGNAFILGKSEYWINPNDELSKGFIIRS